MKVGQPWDQTSCFHDKEAGLKLDKHKNDKKWSPESKQFFLKFSVKKKKNKTLTHFIVSLFFPIAVLTLLLNDRSQLIKASNITSSSVVQISSTANHIKTTSVSFYATQTTCLTKKRVSSIVSSQSETFTTKTTSSSSKASEIPRTTISVTQFNDVVTPTTAVHVVGLPDEKVIFAIAGILGAILVILLGILVSQQ